jgi:hypothetical protein
VGRKSRDLYVEVGGTLEPLGFEGLKLNLTKNNRYKEAMLLFSNCGFWKTIHVYRQNFTCQNSKSSIWPYIVYFHVEAKMKNERTGKRVLTKNGLQRSK